MIDEMGAVKDAVFYNKLVSDCQSIRHSGDQRDGTAEGYDEKIEINGSTVNFGIAYLAILINSYNG